MPYPYWNPKTKLTQKSVTRMTRFAKLRYAVDPLATKASNLLKESPGRVRWMTPRLTAAKANPTLFAPLEGSRLAVVLHEIRDRFGKFDPELHGLATNALRGAGDINATNNVYTQIRNKLLAHARNAVPFKPGTNVPLRPGQPRLPGRKPTDYSNLQNRAKELAHNYNWHRVGAGLQVDEAVKDYVDSIAKDRLKSRNEHLRAAHNLFGIGSQERQANRQVPTPYPEPSQEDRHGKAYNTFWNGLVNHVKKIGVGPESIYGLKSGDVNKNMLERSLRRLAEHEENIHGGPGTASRITIDKGKPVGTLQKPPQGITQGYHSSKVQEVAPLKPAWSTVKATQVPVRGKPGVVRNKPAGVRVSPTARAGQYKRRPSTFVQLRRNAQQSTQYAKDKNLWISAKIKKIMSEGVKGKKVKQKQAVAIAESMWREHNGD